MKRRTVIVNAVLGGALLVVGVTTASRSPGAADSRPRPEPRSPSSAER